MGSFEHTNVIATLQYLKATENPNAAAPRDVERNGSSGFIEVRLSTGGPRSREWTGSIRIRRSREIPSVE